MSKLIEQLKKDEDFKNKAYRCPNHFLTIGYGFNLDSNGLPQPVADFWLDYLVKELTEEVTYRFKWFDKLNQPRKDVVLNMCYNIGVYGFMLFKKVIAAIEKEDYETAADEMINSKWADQVGMRAARLSMMMRKGKYL